MGYFDNFVNEIEKHPGKNICRIHTDHDPEFIRIRKELGNLSIILTTSSPYAPQLKGLAERFESFSLRPNGQCL